MALRIFSSNLFIITDLDNNKRPISESENKNKSSKNHIFHQKTII